MAPDHPRFAFLKDPMVRRVAVFGGGAALLAGVILAGAALSAPRKSEPPKKVVTSLSPANESARLVDAAETALASGETTKAKELVRQALALDPSSEKAAGLFDEISNAPASDATTESAEATPSPSDSPGAPTTPVDEEPFEAKVDVKTLLPTAIAGYWLGMVVAAPADAVVSAEPQPGSPAYRKVVRVLLTVRDRGTRNAADAFIPNVSRKLYTQSSAEATVGGTPAYFGTDGRRLATLVFVRGRYVFELLGTADTITAAATQPYLVTVAETFPTAP